MPQRNATGPNGQGPMTGGGRGNCGGRGQGRGNRGQGFSFGGGGRRQRNQFNANDSYQPRPIENEELELRNMLTQHEEALTTIKQRLEDLSNSPRKGEDS